jgi:CBS domain-containing protein
MSPRAACRLDALGFAHVYDYTAGKAEWLAYGLPTEGAGADRPRAAQFARDDVATCGLDDRVDRVRERVAASPFGFALVLSGSGVLLGRLRRNALEHSSAAVAHEVMETGPSTVRPDTDAAQLAARLTQSGLSSAIVTTPDGRLVGVVRARDLPGPGADA